MIFKKILKVFQIEEIKLNTCKDCRFNDCNKCVKFGIIINEQYKACNDYASTNYINESCDKIQLND